MSLAKEIEGEYKTKIIDSDEEKCASLSKQLDKALSSCLDKLAHFSSSESMILVLYSPSISFARDIPIFPPPTILTLE